VLNWSILRDDKVKLTKYQNHHHHGGVFDTRTEWVKPQAERAQGPVDGPAMFYVGLARSFEDTCLYEE
jgi:hypothetical protein